MVGQNGLEGSIAIGVVAPNMGRSRQGLVVCPRAYTFGTDSNVVLGFVPVRTLIWHEE